MPLESCTGVHGASKFSWEPKTVDYSPRKRTEMREITSFDDAAGVMYRGVTGRRNPPGTPRKRSEIPEITSFHDAAGVMYWGSRGIRILPGHKKHGL